MFERFVVQLLAQMAAGGEQGRTDPSAAEDESGFGTNPGVDDASDFGADFVIQLEDRPLLVLAKAQKPQTVHRLASLIEHLHDAAARFSQASPGVAVPRLVVAFPGVLSPSREKLSATQRGRQQRPLT